MRRATIEGARTTRKGGALDFPLMDGEPDSAYYESERVEPWWV